ncbi:MAG TPA: cytochrome c oxidase subunit II [Kineosporiaceae bacterium]|nr:cytochrome c oxidase subunit II [Kineosporiaceae bacterium]
MSLTEARPADAEPPGEPSTSRPAWRRAPIFPILLIWIVLTALLVAFALVVPARLMGAAASPTMREIETTFTSFSLAAAPVAALVWAILLYSLVAWRYRGGGRPTDPGPPVRGNNRVQVVWVVVSTALCLFLLIWGLIVIQPSTSEASSTQAPLVVDVTGQQWVWNFEYPAAPGAQSDELYLPVNQRVLFRVTSKDVVHSFWITQMGVKVDANPGATTTISVTPDRLGTFDIRCAELCGLYHSYMQTHVHVVRAEEFRSWLATAASQAPTGEVPSPSPSGTATS